MGAQLRDLRKQRFSEDLPVLHCQEAEQWSHPPAYLGLLLGSGVGQDGQGLLDTAGEYTERRCRLGRHAVHLSGSRRHGALERLVAWALLLCQLPILLELFLNSRPMGALARVLLDLFQTGLRRRVPLWGGTA
eukprot:5978934-Alexandrium_andersonii.AAC.1